MASVTYLVVAIFVDVSLANCVVAIELLGSVTPAVGNPILIDCALAFVVISFVVPVYVRL